MQLSSRTIVQCSFVLATVIAPVIVASCAHGAIQEGPGGTTGGGSSGSGVSLGGSSGAGVSVATGGNKCTPNPCNDFSATPIMDPAGMPSSNPASVFGAATNGTTSNGPCLIEPADKSHYPKNWLRPRIVWKPGTSTQTVFEVRIHTTAETNDLDVYTTNSYWTMDESNWQQIAYAPPDAGTQPTDGNLIGADITVTVRGSDGGTPTISNSSTFSIAPAIADGALVYWTTSSFDNNANNTTLQGFHVGDEAARRCCPPVVAGSGAGPRLAGRRRKPDGELQAGVVHRLPHVHSGRELRRLQRAVALAGHCWRASSRLPPGAVPTWLSKGAAQNLSPDYLRERLRHLVQSPGGQPDHAGDRYLLALLTTWRVIASTSRRSGRRGTRSPSLTLALRLGSPPSSPGSTWSGITR